MSLSLDLTPYIAARVSSILLTVYAFVMFDPLLLECLPVTPLPSTAAIDDQRAIDAAILNLSGRQRMLSQRLALLLLQLASAAATTREPIRQELQALLHTLLTTHQALIQGDATLRLPSQHSAAIAHIYFDPTIDLDRRLKQYIHQATQLLQLPDPELTLEHPDLQQLVTQESVALLQALEQLVQQFSQESELRQTQRLNQLLDLCQQHESALQTVQTQATALYQTQAQLVQSEKMASLAQLVAGVAHEINNPVTFIHGNLKHAIGYSQDLIKLVQIYQSCTRLPVAAIQTYEAEIDVAFLMQDLPQVLESMQTGTTRLRDMVLALRNFARLDEAALKTVNLHEGLDSALLLLQHRIDQFGLQYGQAMAIQRDYGAVPLVPCYASQINQVFMEVLLNAIDGLADRMAGQPPITPTIQITTTHVPERESLSVTVMDNGSGISETNQARIFDPFFTTKPVGQGKGLGLSISYQIIEQHQGTIHCETPPSGGTTIVIQLPLKSSV
jgi:two-component system, NtrC family, sensor kinase